MNQSGLVIIGIFTCNGSNKEQELSMKLFDGIDEEMIQSILISEQNNQAKPPFEDGKWFVPRLYPT